MTSVLYKCGWTGTQLPSLYPAPSCGHLPDPPSSHDSRGSDCCPKAVPWVSVPVTTCEFRVAWSPRPKAWLCQLRQWAPERERTMSGRQNLPHPLTPHPTPPPPCIEPVFCLVAIATQPQANRYSLVLRGKKLSWQTSQNNAGENRLAPDAPPRLGEAAEIIKNSTLGSHRLQQKEGSRP